MSVHLAPPPLSSRAHFALARTALRACQVARELADQGGPDARNFQDALAHLRAIVDSVLARLGEPCPLDLDPERRTALRSIFAWAARDAEPVLQRELRRYARNHLVTR
jgi:hypothetical protein